ncbi:hypothetical protein Tco_1371271 [Tanacetum coccineum]
MRKTVQRKTYDIGSFIKWFCKRTGKKKLCKADLEGPAFNLVKAFHKNNTSLEDIISSLWLEIVNANMDISAVYGINHGGLGGRNAISTITVSPPDLWKQSDRRYEFSVCQCQERIRNLHPNDLKILPTQYSRKAQPSARDRQDLSSHSSQHVDKKPADYYFKEDYTIVPKPRAIVYRDINDQRKLMRLNELHKFSDGTHDKSNGKMDHMVKGLERRTVPKEPHAFYLIGVLKVGKVTYYPNDPAITGGIYPGTIHYVSVEVLSYEVTDHLKMELEMEIPCSSNVKKNKRMLARHTLGELTTAFERRVNNSLHKKALHDALVALAGRLEFEKCNMRLKIDIKPKEAAFQVVLDALALTPFYQAFIITADICPRIPGQEFEDLLLEQDILSFIRYLRHTRDITYLTNVNVDYLHQPWREFATVINKCLSGIETGNDKIRLSRAQILWGMYYKKNIDYVYLLWEDFLFLIEYKDAKKTNKMSYPSFTKIIIDYFMSKDQSISRHEDTQVYGTILPKELTNQEMLKSNAYKTYYAFASGEKATKPKYVQKKANPDASPKQKLVQATKGTRLNSKAKVAKPNKKKQPAKKPKAKRLAVLSEVPDEQQQKSFGTDEGTGTKPRVPDVPIYESESDKESWGDSEDEDNENDYNDLSDECDDDNDGNNGNDGDDDDANDDKQKGDDTNDDDEETDSDKTESDRIKIPILDQSTTEYYKEEEEKIDDEETMYDDEDDEVIKELYKDVNQVEEDAHVTLTPVLDTQKTGGPTQSSFVSSNFTSKLLNLDNLSLTDNEIASLMDTTTQHATIIPEITSSFTTTIPSPPPFFNPLLQQATPTPTPTVSNTTTSLPALPDFTYVFKFNERVTNLEKDLSEIKKVDQYAQALSSIPSIVDRYMDNKLGEAINKAIQAHNFNCREEAQVKKREYIELVDSTVRTLIKEEVNAQLPQILPQAVSDFVNPVIEKNVTESVEVVVLRRSSSQPTSTYKAATSLFEFELTKILIDKIEKNKSYDKDDYTDKYLFDSYGTKRRKSSKDVESFRDLRSKEKKSSSISKDASQCQHKSSGKSAHAEEPSNIVEDLSMQQDQEFITGNNDEQPADKEVAKADWFKKPDRPPTRDPDWNLEYLKGRDLSRRYSTSVTKTKAATYELKWIKDLVPELWSTVQLKYDQHAYLEEELRRRVEDLQLGVESYQKKLNLTKPNTYRSNLRNKTAYTSYSDPHGIIYVNQYKRKRLMRADELHKFSDGTLNDVRPALYDIAAGIRMEYLPMRKWSNLDKKRAWVMVQDIDK